MSEIEPYLERGRVVVKKGGASIEDVAKALLEPERTEEQVGVVPFPPVPKPVVLTEEDKQALKNLADVFAMVQPEVRRVLTGTEREQVHAELTVLKTITTLMKTREEALKEIIRHHIDVAAEKSGRAFPTGTDEHEATLRDEKGHYILARPQEPERISVPSTNLEWSQEFTSGGVGVNPAVLEQMVEDGELDRKVYLAMTEVPKGRVFNENKALLAAANPTMGDAVLRAIKRMTYLKKPHTSLFTNRKKKD